ncbi:unnamed protein product [Amoebophrya sp. A120]|nr:unnamed protein product [Amoebophrya sp. A120]|eukprot:GSA120T00013429001.1
MSMEGILVEKSEEDVTLLPAGALGCQVEQAETTFICREKSSNSAQLEGKEPVVLGGSYKNKKANSPRPSTSTQSADNLSVSEPQHNYNELPTLTQAEEHARANGLRLKRKWRQWRKEWSQVEEGTTEVGDNISAGPGIIFIQPAANRYHSWVRKNPEPQMHRFMVSENHPHTYDELPTLELAQKYTRENAKRLNPKWRAWREKWAEEMKEVTDAGPDFAGPRYKHWGDRYQVWVAYNHEPKMIGSTPRVSLKHPHKFHNLPTVDAAEECARDRGKRLNPAWRDWRMRWEQDTYFKACVDRGKDVGSRKAIAECFSEWVCTWPYNPEPVMFLY